MKKTLIAVATALTLSTSTVLAAPSTSPSYLVGADLGYGGAIQNPNGLLGNTNKDKQGFVYGFNFATLTGVNSQGVSYGMELGYTNYASYKIDNLTKDDTTVSASSFNYLGVFKYELNNGVYFIGKAGMAYMMQNVATQLGITSQAAYQPLFAVGTGMDLSAQLGTPLSADLTYQYVAGTNGRNVNVTANSTQPTSTILLGIKYALPLGA